MFKEQKTQEEWKEEYESGVYSPMDLHKAGFKPRSNKYHMAVKEYKYHKEYYPIILTLTPEDYGELKSCPYKEEQNEIEEQERKEYERIIYLLNKYGESEDD